MGNLYYATNEKEILLKTDICDVDDYTRYDIDDFEEYLKDEYSLEYEPKNLVFKLED